MKNIQTPNQANTTHYEVGKTVREAIQKVGGTMPEDLPTPEKSVKELEKDINKQISDSKDKN